jgi:NTP pyrophosphatase (non-canonical NTP hydrolase)
MADDATTVAELRNAMRQFVAERGWEVFHNPKNLAMGIAIESAELMEHFQWLDLAAAAEAVRDPARRSAIAEEMADVANYLFALANVMDLDLSDAVRDKNAKNVAKYPADKYQGRYEKPV